MNTTGHRNALKLDVTTVSPTSAGNHAYFTTMLEGQDCQRPLYGTANAKDITLSFWVKSSKTGVYNVSLYSLDATNYQIPIEYTISSANTWEKKEILISPTAGRTSLITSSGGLIANGNAQAFSLFFGLHWEPSLEGTNNTWVTGGGAYGTSNQVNWLDSTSNTFYITGIQLEVGSSATPFEHRSYGEELARCQRYYFRWNAAFYPYTPLCSGQGYNGSSANALMHFPTTMRTAPSFTFSSASHFWFSQGTGNPACSGMSQWGSGIHTSILIATVSNTAGYGGYLRAGNSTSAWAAWSAEF